jgi:hypothetical protein
MKRLLLALGLCVVAVVVAPVASAGAAPLVGKCNVEGNANFKAEGVAAALPFGVPAEREYEFKSEKVAANELPEALKKDFPLKDNAVECKEPEAGPPPKVNVWKGVATVTPGEGLLSCGAAFAPAFHHVVTPEDPSLKEGEVDLKLSKNGKTPWEKEFDLDLQVGAVGGTVWVKVGKSPEVEGRDVVTVEATGEANFVEPGEAAAKAKRAEECVKGEVTELPFYATLAGTLTEGS